MTLKTLNSGSDGNCYILTSDSGEKLILDAGIPIADIKRGLDYDIEHVVGGVCSHEHLDHSLSVKKLKKMGITVFQPYLYDAKRLHTKIGCFDIQSFDVPHNGTPNRAFIITADATDFEYIPYDLSKQEINIALIELNYQLERVDGSNHLKHTVLGHTEESTVAEFLATISKYLRKVILCHMSKSGALDKESALKHIKEVVMASTEVLYAVPGKEYDISKCPF